jgi:hypothetical protein
MTNTPKLAIAIGYIDDDLVTGAVEYMPAKKSKIAWLRHSIIAACLCLTILVVANVTINLLPKPGSSITGGEVYEILAEVVTVMDDGRYEVKITGRDQNFADNDIVIFNYDGSEAEETIILKSGDVIEITYSIFEKTGAAYEITSGDILVIQSSTN